MKCGVVLVIDQGPGVVQGLLDFPRRASEIPLICGVVLIVVPGPGVVQGPPVFRV